MGTLTSSPSGPGSSTGKASLMARTTIYKQVSPELNKQVTAKLIETG